MKNIFFILTFFLVANCSHIKNENNTEKPPIVEVDGENLVSAQVAFDLAFSSYLKACVDIHHLHGKMHVFKECSRLSRSYIEDLMVTFKFKKPLKSAN